MDIKTFLRVLSGFGSQKMEDIGFIPFLMVMTISLLCALFISYLYVRFYKSRATGSHIYRTFPLLGISITAIFITIQFSLPLSLGLLGALSIVRFRTPIKEPEEIGFIMLVVATSLCCATFNMFFLGVILIVAVVALWILKLSHGFLKGRLNDGMLIITMPTSEYRGKSDKVLAFLEKKLPRGRVDSITENKEESIVSYSFIRLENNILMEIQRELRDISASTKSNVFFNRSSEV